MRQVLIRALLAFMVVTGASQAVEPQDAAGGDFSDVERWVQRFEDPSRIEWQRPRVVLRLLGLGEGDTIADLGTGTGYFLPWLSSMVGPNGKVYAVDIEPALLEYVRQRKDFGYPNVETILADPDDPKLPEGSLTVVLIVDTWHHIEDRADYLGKLGRSLRADGRVVVIDYRKEELPVGPPVDHKLSRDEVVAEFTGAGWTFAGESVALPYQYYLTFRPPREKRGFSSSSLP